MTASVLIISLILVCSIAAITLDTLFFRKQKRVWRATFYSILLFIILSVMFGIVEFFSEEVDWETFGLFILFSFVISLLVAFGNYFNLVFVDWRVRRLREKYSKLPDGPRKQSLMKMLEKLESQDNK